MVTKPTQTESIRPRRQISGALESSSMNTLSHYFEGKERIEPFPFTGMLLRKGTPAALSISDRQRILHAARTGDVVNLGKYLEIVHFTHVGIVTYFLEWSLQFPTTLAGDHYGKQGAELERRCTSETFEQWSRAVESIAKDPDTREAVSLLSSLFAPDSLKPGTAKLFRKQTKPRFKGIRTVAAPLLREVAERQEASLKLIREGAVQEFETHFANYWNFIAAVHDGITQYDQTYPAVVNRLVSQEASEELLHRSFSQCSFFEMLWMFLHVMTPHELAGFYADHLRGHFSGGGREGSVEIIEEEDRYRLIPDACGSGGAMRRRLAQAGSPAEVFANASSSTWGLKNQVPPYCSHCAMNEKESIRRFGFPVQVTEFDPDPNKPCGWTMYKDPNKIPEHVFTRLGHKKDPSKFRQVNLKYKILRFFGIRLGIQQKVVLPDLSR